jgi:DNA-directed RNA polymerase specialized sigma24 family protein
LAEQINKALDLHWTPRQANLIRWYWIEGVSMAEMAEWLNLSKQGVNRELYAIRVAVRAGLGFDMPTFQHGRPQLAPAA